MLAPPIPLARNVRHRVGAMTLLAQVRDGAAALAFFDPQYRGVLDRQKYGNEGARQKGRAALPQMTYPAIRAVLDELERVLRTSGHLVLWVDKFTVASGHHVGWIPEGLQTVDMASWNKGRFGMGRRLRCQQEFALILQKPPTRAKGVWTDNGFPDVWLENQDRSVHPHAKPVVWTQRLIRAVTKPRDLVIDPCAGGYGVLDACLATNRQFLGCDIAGSDDVPGR